MKNKSALRVFSLLAVLLLPFSYSLSQSTRQDTVTMYFAGDVTLANHFEEEVGDSLSYPFAKIQWLGDADVAMVNLENPITTRGTETPKEFNFR